MPPGARGGTLSEPQAPARGKRPVARAPGSEWSVNTLYPWPTYLGIGVARSSPSDLSAGLGRGMASNSTTANFTRRFRNVGQVVVPRQRNVDLPFSLTIHGAED